MKRIMNVVILTVLTMLITKNSIYADYSTTYTDKKNLSYEVTTKEVIDHQNKEGRLPFTGEDVKCVEIIITTLCIIMLCYAGVKIANDYNKNEKK